MQTANQSRQRLCILARVVVTGEQNVFDGHLAPALERVPLQRFDQFIERIFFGDRHDLFAPLAIGRVDGDGQIGTAFDFRQRIDPRNDAGRGHGHALRRDIRVQDLQCALEVIEIQQRLAHAHEDDVHRFERNLILALNDEKLSDHFRGGEIASGAEESGHAKRAADRATGLRGETNAGAIAHRHVHRLDPIAVREPEQILLTSIRCRSGPFDHPRKLEREALSEFGAKVLRQIAHVVERFGAMSVHPFGNLFDAERRRDDLAQC